MSRPPIERRVTPWKPLWFESPHCSHVRIWQEFDGVRWWQMHEWRNLDGSSDASQGWIIGTRGWSPNAIAANEPAPGDPPPLFTPEEVAYLVERLRFQNDPLAAVILNKLGAIL